MPMRFHNSQGGFGRITALLVLILIALIINICLTLHFGRHMAINNTYDLLQEETIGYADGEENKDSASEPISPFLSIAMADRGQLTIEEQPNHSVDYRMKDNMLFVSADDFLVALGYSYVHPDEGTTGDEGFIYDSWSQCRYQKNGEVICFYKNTNNITIADQALVLSAPLYQPEDSPWEIFVPAEEFLKAMGYFPDMRVLTIVTAP